MVLDIGCGRGGFTSFLLKKGYTVVGIDINRLRLRQASKFADVILSDCHTLPFKDRSFDLVCILQVLHHIEEPQKTLDGISRVLKDGGVLHVTEIVENNPLFKLLRNIHPFWEGDPVKTRLTREELRKILSQRFSPIREDLSYGNFYWLWVIFVTRFKDNSIIAELTRFAERQIDRVLKNYFSCAYQAILRLHARHFSSPL